MRATRVRFQDLPRGDNPGQQLYHARAEQLGELGLPGCDEALSGMGGASLTIMKFRELCNGGFPPKLVTPPNHGFLNVNTPPNSQNSKWH